jgi:ubiquinone/menaquinone biosynthesis C-methylase UbiE/uncharacterized protein YbaR (Trm112 family)
MNKNTIKKLKCPVCNSQSFDMDIDQKICDDILFGRLLCQDCLTEYPIKDGILQMIPNRKKDEGQQWDKVWRDTGLQITKRKIEKINQKRETARTLYPPLEISERLNLQYKECLDIGCGSGSFSLALKKAGKISSAYLVDYSLQALYLAKGVYEYFGEQCELIQGDARNLSFKDGSFGLSFSTGLLEHFDKLSQETIIKEHCRVANDVICQVPVSSVPYWIGRFLITVFNLKWPFSNEKPLSITKLKQLLIKTNYVVKDVSYHDMLTSICFFLSLKTKCIKPLGRKTFLNRLLRHEVAVYALKIKQEA